MGQLGPGLSPRFAIVSSTSRRVSPASLKDIEQTWKRLFPTAENLFQVWDLRHELAALSGATPLLLRDASNQAALPLAEMNGRIGFFGGRYFNERNRIPGGEDHVQALLQSLTRMQGPVRLLSLEQDLAHLRGATSGLRDVPYNQYWEFTPQGEFEDYLQSRSAKRRKRIRSFFRNDQIRIERLLSNPMDDPAVRALMKAHGDGFAARQRSTTNFDPLYHRSLEIVFGYALRHAALYGIWARQDEAAVGFGTLIVSPAWRHGVFLTNFYLPSYSDASHMVVSGIIKAAYELKVAVDGMRGAFGLKKLFRFSPVSSYALVRDANWKVQEQGDLTPQEIQALYGRTPVGD